MDFNKSLKTIFATHRKNFYIIQINIVYKKIQIYKSEKL